MNIYAAWIAIKVFLHDLFFPYNKVKIKTLNRHYHETDDIMLHACFQIFVNFYENEYINFEHEIDTENYFIEMIKKGYPEDHLKLEIVEIENNNKIHRSFVELYTWWKHIRPNRIKAHIEDSSFIDWDSDDEEDQRMLMKLLELRSCLWT